MKLLNKSETTMCYILIFIAMCQIIASLTCDELLQLPENKKVSLNEVQTMQPKEIVNCVPHLGKDKLTPIEAEFIWNTIKTFYKGVSNIPEEVLRLLRYVTVAVQPEDYANLTLDGIDIISNFGINYGLTEDQLEAIVERVREDFGFKQPEDYTFYDLTALGQILCAFNRSEIDRIHPKAYKEAAGSIGKLANCNNDIMQGFANLATHEDAFGSLASWSDSTIEIVGAVVNFLPKESLSKLKSRLGFSSM